jgi:hypothetical protein
MRPTIAILLLFSFVITTLAQTPDRQFIAPTPR